MKDLAQLEGILSRTCHLEIPQRLKGGEELLIYLSNPSYEVDFWGESQLVDSVVSFTNSSNTKLSLLGVELIALLAQRAGPDFKVYLPTVLSGVTERFGDSKAQVREATHNCIQRIADATSVQLVVEHLLPVLSHKLWRVKEETIVFVTNLIKVYGIQQIPTQKLITALARLLADASLQVREASISCLVELYGHFGEKLRQDMMKKGLPQAKLSALFSKFDSLMKTRKSDDDVASSNDSGDSAIDKNDGASFIPRPTKPTFRKPSADRDNAAGAVDESDLIASWNDCSDIRIDSWRDATDIFNKINTLLPDVNTDWEDRVLLLRQLRAITRTFGSNRDLLKSIRDLTDALQCAVRDLRSQLVREACVAISYMSSVFGPQFEFIAELLLPSLINLILSSAKIMATSGHATVLLIIRHSPSCRYVPLFTSNLLTNKSKEIRKRCAEYTYTLLDSWDTSYIKSHVTALEDSIKKGVGDADPEARAAVRRAFWAYSKHFKERSDILFHSFDSSKQKMLLSDLNLIQNGGQFAVPAPVKSAPQKSTPKTTSKHDPVDAVDSGPRSSGLAVPTAIPGSLQRSSSSLDTPLRRNLVVPSAMERQKSEIGFKGVPTVRRSPSVTASSPAKNPPKVRPITPRGSMRASAGQKRMNTVPVPFSNGSSSVESGWNAGIRSLRPATNTGSSTDLDDDTDDACSTTSMTSDSGLSSPGISQGSVVTMNIDEIVVLLSSKDWNDRKNGLVSLLSALQSRIVLSYEQVLRVKDSLNKYFMDPRNMVYSMFLDVLCEFVILYKRDLHDWLFVLLTRLLQKLGGENLASMSEKIARALDVMRDSFQYDYQFMILMRYITDNTQMPSTRVKGALLQYLTGLVSWMDSSAFTNSGETRLAISKIISWATDPKCLEIRKDANQVVIGLFELNTPEFTALLSLLPAAHNSYATKVIQSHVQNSADPDSKARPMPRSHVDGSTAITGDLPINSPTELSAHASRSQSVMGHVHVDSARVRLRGADRPESAMSNVQFPPQKPESPGRQAPSASLLPVYSPPHSSAGPAGPRVPVLARKDALESPLTRGDVSSQDSGYKNGSGSISSYNPLKYQDIEALTRNISGLSLNPSSVSHEDRTHPVSVESMLNSLASPNLTVVQKAIEDLSVNFIEQGVVLQSITAAAVVRRLCQIISDHSGPQYESIQLLNVACRMQPGMITNNFETILSVLLDSAGSRTTEMGSVYSEIFQWMVKNIPTDDLLAVICTKIDEPSSIVVAQALDGATKIIEFSSKETVRNWMPSLAPMLLKAYDHPEGVVRKNVVFCLVAMHSVIGEEELEPYIKDLSVIKRKLLNVYIKRYQTLSSTH